MSGPRPRWRRATVPAPVTGTGSGAGGTGALPGDLGLARGEAMLRRLELTVRRRLDGLLQGEYLGLMPGAGTERADARVYVPGQDDVRRMDWYATARLGEPYVRDLVADHELESWAVVDLTPSMDFGTAWCEKRDLAVAAVAAIGFLGSRGGNRLGAYTVTPSGVRMMPARSGRAALYGLLGSLVRSERGEPSEVPGPTLPSGIARLSRHRHRGVRLVVSDFLDTPVDGTPPPWEPALRRLSRSNHVLAVEVVDPRELSLPDVGMLTLVDPETGRRREVSTSSRRMRERYEQAAAEQRQAVADAVRRSGAAHLVLRTDRDWVRDVAQFAERERRRRSGPGNRAWTPVNGPVDEGPVDGRPGAPPARPVEQPGAGRPGSPGSTRRLHPSLSGDHR